jgi:pimeloyl-ACP methyl ester carboxylesterase
MPALLLSTLWLAACGGDGVEETMDRDLPLTPCHVRGVDAETFCGSYTVYEDREAASGRTINLRVVVVPALNPKPQPDALFFLAGGPGQAASEVMAAALPNFYAVHKNRDIVFIDQRGTGSSNPLDCPDETGGTLAGLFGGAELDPEALEHCLEGLDADPTLYTTPLAMDDLDDVRAVLGYERINLYGVSYGTRAALVYMRRHPERVRSAILDGVVPTEMEVFLHFARDGQAALESIFTDCAASESCSSAFPDLEQTFNELLESFDPPREITVDHPLSGAEETFEVTRDALAGNVRGLLYAPYLTALLPLAVDQAAKEEFDPLVAQSQGLAGGVSDGMSLGMMLSVVCAEDLPRITPGMREDASVGTFLGDAIVGMMADACETWPRGALPPGYNDPVHSEAPALVLSGALDPVTPPRWGDQALRGLPNGVHAIAPGAGHNVAPYGCAPRRIAEFIETADARALDLDCFEDIQRPAFFIDFAGPAQ